MDVRDRLGGRLGRAASEPMRNQQEGCDGKFRKEDSPSTFFPSVLASAYFRLYMQFVYGPSPRLAPRQRYIRGGAVEGSDRGHFPSGPWLMVTGVLIRRRVLGISSARCLRWPGLQAVVVLHESLPERATHRAPAADGEEGQGRQGRALHENLSPCSPAYGGWIEHPTRLASRARFGRASVD